MAQPVVYVGFWITAVSMVLGLLGAAAVLIGIDGWRAFQRYRRHPVTQPRPAAARA
jgi:hypothetical protein